MSDSIPTTKPPQGVASEQSRVRSAGTILAVAAVFHLVSVPVSLVLFQYQFIDASGQPFSFGQIFDSLNRAGYGYIEPLMILGAVAQFTFAIAAGFSAHAFRNGRRSLALPMIVMGVLASVISIGILGGFLGLFGGICAIGGGALAQWPNPPSWFVPPSPPS